MAHSLEGRAPFLQPQLVEMGLHLPEHERMAHGNSKIALRRVAGRWLPQEIMHRRKQGFVLPMAHWLKQWFEAHGGVEAYFAGQYFPGLDINQLCQIVKHDIDQGIHRERFIFALIILIECYKNFQNQVKIVHDSYLHK